MRSGPPRTECRGGVQWRGLWSSSRRGVSPPPVDPGTGNERPGTSGCGCEAHPGAGASAPFAFALVLLLGRLARRGSRSFLSV
ncbi:MYXO-CTERM sorting domain-containing protein [Myxococcus sp. CA051A]|uniref:MYXO-CTERM sorting domain-containing protein n=1 Tax=Myxococcus sp. CA051A TaxID=2741739 RepID=UPI00352FEFE3